MSITTAINKANERPHIGKSNHIANCLLEQRMNEKRAAASSSIQRSHYQYSIAEHMDIREMIPALLIGAGFWFVMGMCFALAR